MRVLGLRRGRLRSWPRDDDRLARGRGWAIARAKMEGRRRGIDAE